MKTGNNVGVLQSDSQTLNYATRTIVCLVALGAAVLSFDALAALAIASGIRVEFAWIWAIVIDGFIMVATFAAFALKDRGPSKYYAWTTLAVFVIFSILGNAWHAAIARAEFILPLEVAVIVTAIPPLALFLAIHLLIIMVSPTHEQKLEHKKIKERTERLQKIKERELEKIEKLAAINEVREEAGLELLTEIDTRTTKRASSNSAKDSSVASKPNNRLTAPTKLPMREVVPIGEKDRLESTTASLVIPAEEQKSIGEDIKTEEEITSILLEKVSLGEALPTGKTISEWLGKSERTGQNFIKRFKEENVPS